MEVINKEQFIDSFQYFDKEIVLEIIDIFIDEYPERIENLEISINNKDFPQLKFHAHSIKGVIANFAAPEAQELARQLENKGSSEDIEGTTELFEELKRMTENMLVELEGLKVHFQ